MYGLINNSVKELVTSKFGEEQWQAIVRKAGLESDTFVSMYGYPDKITYDLVAAASEVLSLEPAVILETFGQHWIAVSAKAAYGDILAMGGSSLVEFLKNLDQLHTRVGAMFPNLVPPSFRCKDVTTSSLRLQYFSERQGLAPFVIGLLKGLGKRFNTDVEVEQVRAKDNGQECDEFLIRYSVVG